MAPEDSMIHGAGR